jgi:hypothetical protein
MYTSMCNERSGYEHLDIALNNLLNILMSVIRKPSNIAHTFKTHIIHNWDTFSTLEMLLSFEI